MALNQELRVDDGTCGQAVKVACNQAQKHSSSPAKDCASLRDQDHLECLLIDRITLARRRWGNGAEIASLDEFLQVSGMTFLLIVENLVGLGKVGEF